MKKTMFQEILLVLCILSVSAQATTKSKTLQYPKTERIDIRDTYHGISVNDPYRWLEKDARHSQQAREWIETQNKVTFEYLRALPHRASIKKHLTELWNYEKIGVPWKIGDRYFISKNDGLQNHHVIYVMDASFTKVMELIYSMFY